MLERTIRATTALERMDPERSAPETVDAETIERAALETMVETTVFQSTTLDAAPTGTCMVGSLLLGTWLGSWVQQQTWILRTSMLGSELLDTGHPPPTLMLGC